MMHSQFMFLAGLFFQAPLPDISLRFIIEISYLFPVMVAVIKWDKYDPSLMEISTVHRTYKMDSGFVSFKARAYSN